MRFEFIEYKLDSNGNEVESSRYEVYAMDFYRTIDILDKAVKNGEISRYEYVMA